MSLATLATATPLTQTSHDPVELDRALCEQYPQHYVVYQDRWSYDLQEQPTLERQVILATLDVAEAEACFRSALANGEEDEGRIMLSYMDVPEKPVLKLFPRFDIGGGD